MSRFCTLLAVVAYLRQSSALALGPRTSYPFNHLVAFGDELSDNGNGSYAHGITGNPANVYGFGTWTDGPVAVSFLADLLGVPLIDYAFGGCCGGGSGGATIDNAYTASSAQYDGAPVPSVYDQIYKNYTVAPPSPINQAMQFIWTGLNDVSQHTDAFYQGDPANGEFAANMSSRVLADAEYLIEAGAPYVFVANIYPKHLAPVTKKYLCSDGSCVQTWGEIISAANSAIESALAGSRHASKLIYYDVFNFMINVMDNQDSYGLTQSLSDYCDGESNAMFQKCISGSYEWQGASTFYWMNFIQPTTVVHRLIAEDMKRAIDSFL